MPTLDLTLPPKLGSGRPAQPILIAYVRPLTLQDVVLAANCEAGWKPAPLAAIRAVHHNIAILLSQGKSRIEVSRITGRSTSNISILQQDPAFQNLLHHYKQMGEQATVDLFQQLSDTGQAALASIQEELEQNPEAIPFKDKLRVVEVMMDRTGHGPTKTTKNLNLTGNIKELVERKNSERRGKVIDVTAKEVSR